MGKATLYRNICNFMGHFLQLSSFIKIYWHDVFSLVQGVRAVIAESYERIHRSNLVGMGIIPLQYMPGENADSLGITGRETFTISLPEELKTGMTIPVQVSYLFYFWVSVNNLKVLWSCWHLEDWYFQTVVIVMQIM